MAESNKPGKWPGVCSCCGMCITHGLPRNSRGRFRSSLADTVNDQCREAIIIVGGNLDGHVGRASNDDTHDNNVYSIRNVEGDYIVKLAGAKSVNIANAMFQKPASQVITC